MAAEQDVWIGASAGAYIPWDGEVGASIAASMLVPFHRDRFWVGGELEYRRFEANVKRGFSPDYHSVLARYVLQYHPFRDAFVSPYVGVGSGIAIHVVERRGHRAGERHRFRHGTSGGSILMGLVGLETKLFGRESLEGFVEGRFESVSDLWKAKGGNWQYEEIGGATVMLGARTRF